jgi:anti-sigma factor RsiW/glycine cleavage system regulatory protein
MKPITPHDPLDDLIAAALHGDLTPEERALFETRLAHDPAAQAAYQEAQAMHDLLEKTHRTAQPDPDFEQRMVSAVRRKLQHPPHRETAWESLLALWTGLNQFIRHRRVKEFAVVAIVVALVAGVALGPITNGTKQARASAEMQMRRQADQADGFADLKSPTRVDAPQTVDANGAPSANAGASLGFNRNGFRPSNAEASRMSKINIPLPGEPASGVGGIYLEPMVTTTPQGGTVRGTGFAPPASPSQVPAQTVLADTALGQLAEPSVLTKSGEQSALEAVRVFPQPVAAPTVTTQNGMVANIDKVKEFPTLALPAPDSTSAAKPAETAPPDSRKLIRNAQLDLEVKSFQAAFDLITALTKSAGGYVDTSNSERGGNGKLQGTIVVKVLPENLDGFLLKLRDLGEVKNQSVSTDDVTKDYFDTQARLVNSQKMEEQLQDLLKRENGKVSDLLAVERELGRVRGEIEQMQGQLKLYDFQVQYATVTMNLAEKDLKQAAAYLLKEQDNFSLFATDVEGTFQKARATADSFKAQVLAANLQHNSGSDVSAELDVMVAPDQIEPFLAQIRGLGRVANFTRQTQRIAQDGGDSNQPADQTLTEKDKVSVQLAIHSDDESRKQVALTVVAKDVGDALDQAKAAALANAGVEILASSLNKTPQGESTAQLSVRVPGREYDTLVGAFRALGRQASLSIQRNDNSGPGANGDDVPVIVSLSLTDNDAPVQGTDLSIIADDPDAQAQQIKKEAAQAGVEVKASSFERQPDGTAVAQMTLRLPLGKYPAFLATLENSGKVESLSVRRADRPDQTQADDTAPAEIALQVHNQRAIVADNDGLWATLRRTFGEGFSALFGSVRVIGVLIAFLAPWVVTLILAAWIARRIYVWKKNR